MTGVKVRQSMVNLIEESRLFFDSSEGSAQTHIESLLLTDTESQLL